MTPTELKWRQAALGLTTTQLAGALGVTVRTVERYRAGQRKISGPVIQLFKLLQKPSNLKALQQKQ